MPNKKLQFMQDIKKIYKSITDVSAANLLVANKRNKLEKKIEMLDEQRLSKIGVQKEMLLFLLESPFFPFDFNDSKKSLNKSYPIKQKNYKKAEEIYDAVIKILKSQDKSNEKGIKLDTNIHYLSSVFQNVLQASNALIEAINKKNEAVQEIEQFKNCFHIYRTLLEKRGITFMGNGGESILFTRIIGAAVNNDYKHLDALRLLVKDLIKVKNNSNQSSPEEASSEFNIHTLRSKNPFPFFKNVNKVEDETVVGIEARSIFSR